jgi:plastocyanin domain-containing protein
MFLDILAVLLALSHVATIALIVLWFALRKPRSRKEFWRRFKAEFLSLSPLIRR